MAENRSLRHQPFVSTALVAVNVIVFVLCLTTDDRLYAAGVLDVADVIDKGEYGRILFSLFLHADTEHLFNNMLILFFLGAMLEREIGHICFGAFYFLSGICGNLLSLLMKLLNNDAAASLGASGAIFGMDGVLLALILFSGKKLDNVTPARVVLMIVLSLYSGFTGGNIDNAAHVGGLVTGFLAGSVMCAVRRGKAIESA